MRHINYLLAAVLIVLPGCLTEVDPDLKNDFHSFTPSEINDSWELSDPFTEGMNAEQLEEIYRSVHSDENLWQIRSLLVVRNGKLIAESYMKDEADRMHPRAIWSCTKQVMSILVGIAIDKGLIESLDDTIGMYLPEVKNYPDKKNITIYNLLTMQSGIGFNNDEHTDILRGKKTSNSLDWILSLPLIFEQGSAFNYNDGDPHIVSAIIQKVTGKPADEWADEVLFSKLQIKNYQWYRYIDGITFGGFGILFTPRELARVAQCVLNNGSFENETVISSGWIQEMVSQKASYENWGFGLYWWIDVERNIFFMNGHGGQYAFVLPDKNMVVVITSEPNTQDNFQLGMERGLQIADRIIEVCD
ncbi:serine hydrolase domain-containing protein [Bacteroidota bacterium]